MILISETLEEVTFQLDSGIRFRVSPEDKMLILGRTWRLCNGYLHAEDYFHRLLFGDEADHKDLDKLNNRRDNLRLATRSQNLANRTKHYDNTSGYKGVTWHNARGRWLARIQVRGKQLSLGLHDTPEQAHAAYVKAAELYFGEFAHG